MHTTSRFVGIALLTVVAACGGGAKSQDAKEQNAKLKTDLLALETACDAFSAANDGASPASLADLVAKDSYGKAFLAADALPSDPWGRPYGYEAPKAAGSKPRVFSLGSDGAVGGEGDAHDVDVAMIHDRMERKGK